MIYRRHCPDVGTEAGMGTHGLGVMHKPRFAAAAPRFRVSVTKIPQTHGEQLDFRCNIIYVTFMAKGSSGRIVIEVERELKEKLYVELARHDLTLKAWFIDRATRFLEMSHHPTLFPPEEFASRRTQGPGGTPKSAHEESK